MKLSKYIVTKKIEDGYVLFSTISKKIIQVNKNFYNELLDINPNNLREIKTNELTYLLNSYFLIDDNVDEKNIIEYLLDKDRLNQEIFSSYIAFSTLCNFACVYCYEEGQTKRNFIMDKKILLDTIEWYKKILLENNYKKCSICSKK